MPDTADNPSADFWPACHYRLLARNAQGWLLPTPAWLRTLYARPELALIEESCAAEAALHHSLQADPVRPVNEQELAALRDADARENWGHVLAWRDALVAAGSLEGWLLALFRSGHISVPPLFIDHAVQTIVRSLLDGSQDAFALRAGEMFFRPQRLSRHEGRLLAGDMATLDLQNQTRGFGDIGRLLAQANIPVKATQMAVLSADPAQDNRADYWQDALRLEPRHNFLLDLTQEIKQELGHGITFHLANANSGLKALAQLLQTWVQHLLGVQVSVTPLQRIDDAQWRWHIGLDAQASVLLDDLYEGREVDEERLSRLVSLFKLEFARPHEMRSDVAGKPVYLGLMSASDGTLRLKPQNLLLNLPLARAS
jgi:Family of unknown function (DUF6352)